MDSGTGNNEPTAANRIASRLPQEDAGNTTTSASANTSGRSQTRPLATATVESLKLAVIEGFQVGRGVARIDPSDMARLGCQSGDIVMITGSRTTAAKVVPT